MRAVLHAAVLVSLAVAIIGPPAASAQDAGAGVGLAGGPGGNAVTESADGIEITAITVRTTGTTGDPARDAAVAAAARDAIRLSPGERWNSLLGSLVLAPVRALQHVESASATVTSSMGEEATVLVVTVRLKALEPAAAAPAGLLATGRARDLPTLYRNGETYVRLLLDGGVGVFSDGKPWFGQPQTFTAGNPLVQDPAKGANTGSRATWTEGYVQFGIGGVVPLVGGSLYAYGAATGMAPYALGQDIFRNDARATVDLEKLYGGLLYAPKESDIRVNVSVGRQNFTLNDGFLISQYASQWNVGTRPAVYLAPRTALDMSALMTVRAGRWVSTTFYLDPNEYEPVNTDTRVLGTNLRYNFDERIAVDATLYGVPESDFLYFPVDRAPVTREGLRAIAWHGRWADPDVLPGVWLEGEVAHQWHDDFAMSAWAGYGTAGYLAQSLPWTPSLSYRYAAFSGDDPATETFERFDPLYSGGLSEWLQGITINKALSQANRRTHRIRFNVAPSEALNLTLDYYLHTADTLNNRGGNPALSILASRDLGQEVQFTTRWAATPNVYIQGIASVALPGRAIEDATGGRARPWTTVQGQLFWHF